MMKKIISFLIILFPWFISLSILIYKLNFNINLFLFVLLSTLLYIFISVILYKNILYNTINRDFLFYFSLLYILNQFFNFYVFYYKNYYISFILCIGELYSLYKLVNKNT